MNRPNDSKKKNKEQRTRRNIIFSTSTVIFAVLVLVFYVISNLPAVGAFLKKILDIFAPLIYGAALAYLCNPILNLFEKHLLRRIRSLYVKRMLSIFLTYLSFVLVIAAIGLLIVPQLVSSVKDLFGKYENLIANTVTYLNQIISDIMQGLPFEAPDGTVGEFISLDKINALLETLIGNVGDLFNVLLSNIQSYGSKLFSSISNAILSLFISFYLLASKEKRFAQIKKLTTALFNEKQNKFIYDTASLAHTAFGGFLGGKLLDALIVGFIEFILFSIFKIPYAPMLATMMGIFNIIPFFGPIIGAIPAGFIVFISEPQKILLFVILVLVIQQIDGNIIEPKVLGDRTGVSSLCVIVAISVMGNLWGVFGMIIGVPLFAVVIALVQQYADAKLKEKGLSDDLDDYYDEDEDEYAYEQMEGVHLDRGRYYLDHLRYLITPKSRRGEKPHREDYLIYPQEAYRTKNSEVAAWEAEPEYDQALDESSDEWTDLDALMQDTNDLEDFEDIAMLDGIDASALIVSSDEDVEDEDALDKTAFDEDKNLPQSSSDVETSKDNTSADV